MKQLLLLALLAYASSASGQTLRSIWAKNEFYNQISASPDNQAVYRTLFNNKLLDIHLFNLSYAQGIDGFIEFKYKFHYATGKSDIPANQSPIDYLLSVIDKYNSTPDYKVALLYYDAVSDDEVSRSTETNFADWLYIKGKHKKVQATEASPKEKIRVWYLSAEHLHKEQTAYTYEQLQDMEALNRKLMGVNFIGEGKAPRGTEVSNVSANTNTFFDGKDVREELQRCLLPLNVLHLIESDKINALVIVPYGVIGQVPFHSIQLNSTIDFVDMYAYSIAPHPCNFLKVFNVNQEKIGKSNALQPKQPLIVGNPKFYSSSSLMLPDLPGAKREADSIAGFFGTTSLTGITANYDSILSRLKNSDFVYLATHAVPSFKDPMNASFIALTPSAKNKTGYLNISTIQKTSNKKTKLVVLSACQTGVGKAYKNGYCNIGRGFFIAGVDNTIMSLWNLDDYQMVPFMTILAQELTIPQPFFPAENLRQAILRFKAQSSNKAYWSPMVNFGICY